MRRNRRRYRKRVIIAYLARALMGLLLVGAVFLLVCGCLYLRDLKRARDKAEEVGNQNVVSNTPPVEEDTQATDESEVPDEEDDSFTIILDAGHGGNDSGTNVTINGKLIEEKHITLSVVEKLKTLFEEAGFNVILTREEDKYVSLDDRVLFSNESKADLFLSIHCNSYDDDTSVSGLECYYWKNREGMAYADSIQKAVKEIEGLRARGSKEGNYEVLRENEKTAVLIEMGFITNKQDRENLLSDEYQQQLAEKIAEGVLNYAQKQEN